MKANWKKILLCGSCLYLAGVSCNSYAALIDTALLEGRNLADLKNTRADEMNVVGSVIMVKGNVYIPFKDLTVYADSAIIDLESRDIEASGNIRLYRVKSQQTNVTIGELERLKLNPEVLVQILGYTTDTLGQQKVNIKLEYRGEVLTAQKLEGNLTTGFLKLEGIECNFKTFACKAKSGERKPNGEIVVRDAEVTSCEYLINDNSHYSISCSEATIYPHQTDGFTFDANQFDTGEHSLIGSSCWLKFYGVPVIWVPMIYKPKDESPGLYKFQLGDSSDWGFYVLGSKRFDFTDYPYSSVKILTDYYNMRGFGYGADLEVNSEISKTTIFGYGLYDLRPYYSSEVENYRLEIPHYRYNFRISNVTHLTPRLDFRGNFDMMSDLYFQEDFFPYAFNADPEPATYGALEYQFDRLSTALYFRARVNDFTTAVERLPEFRIDVPRQELFSGSNLYYQGENSVDYLQMRWRNYDKPRPLRLADPADYQSFRFDTLHFIYYPLEFKKYGLEFLDWLNVIPRAGGRFTAYSASSDTEVTTEDLNQIFIVNRPEDISRVPIVNYDDNGGARGRFVAEFGVEANTKLSYSWQNIRNAYWRLDGLRHVMEPYINYTFIPKPTVDREYLYFFDDIDRIDKQNFMRFGVRNRLQTRRGSLGREKVYNWLTMENYWDLYMEKDHKYKFNNAGDFCTKIAFNPSEKLTLSTFFSIDAGGNNSHNAEAQRRGRDAGRPGLDLNWLNQWNFNIKYELFEDCTVNLGYVYQDVYHSRSAYSMGSTLTDLESGSFFDKYFDTRTQELTAGITVPLSNDRTFFGSYDIFYDFEAGFIREQRVRLLKVLHCWTVGAEAGQEISYDSDGDRDYDYSFFVTASLNGLPGPLARTQQSALASFRNLQNQN